MPKTRSSVVSASVLALLMGWSMEALAQDAPPAEPPAPPPAPPVEPAAPAEPPPAAPAEPPPAPPPVAPAPPSDSFPLPPDTAPVQKKPAPPPPAAATPAPSFDEPAPTPAPAPAEKPRPQRATEGLFEEKRPVPPQAPRDQEEERDTDHFKIGPVLGVGLPSVFSIGGTMKLTRYIGLGANIGIIPTVQLSYYGDATLSYQHYDVYGRLYPLGGGFFLQGGAGYATVDGTLTKTVGANTTVTHGGETFTLPATFAYESQGSVRTLMLTALIGYFHTTKIGFSFGVDAGAQIPIAPSQIKYARQVPQVGRNADEQAALEKTFVTPIDDSVTDTLESIGRSVIPTANLRIGWIL